MNKSHILLNLSFPISRYTTFSSLVVAPVVVNALQFLLYGVYCMLFTSCIVLLTKNASRSTFILVSITSLFVLATLSLLFETGRILRDTAYFFSVAVRNDELMQSLTSVAGKRLEYAFNAIAAILYLLGNIIADMILVHRCYVIWGERTKMAIAPAVACTFSNLFGTACTILIIAKGAKSEDSKWFNLTHLMMGAYMILNLIITMALISLVAGRIWWISYHSRGMASSRTRKKFNLLAAIILESGLIYPLVQVPNIVFNTVPALVGWDFAPLLIQVAGIAPTLIIVRSQRGISVEDNGLFSNNDVSLSTYVSTTELEESRGIE